MIVDSKPKVQDPDFIFRAQGRDLLVAFLERGRPHHLPTVSPAAHPLTDSSINSTEATYVVYHSGWSIYTYNELRDA